MKSLLLSLGSLAALTFAGCASENHRASSQIPAYPPPPPLYSAQPSPEPVRDYGPGPSANYPASPSESSPSEGYRDQAPQYGSQAQEPDIPSVDSTRDFEAPLAQYGRWLDTPEYGRVWQPDDQPNDWRPYGDDGRWVYTSYGWTWESDRPWGWATFHYGNWVYRPYCGWVWVPGTVWAPAWVEWRECDDYVAWAPSPPPHCPRYYPAQDYCGGVRYIDFVIVFRQDFCKPVGSKVVVKNIDRVKIINKSTNITKTKVVNKFAHNPGPDVRKIEQATKEKVRVRNVRDVAKTDEALKQTNRSASLREPAREKGKEAKARLDFEKPAKKQASVEPRPVVAPAPTTSTPKLASANEERPRRKAVSQDVQGPVTERPKRFDPGSSARVENGATQPRSQMDRPVQPTKQTARGEYRDQVRDQHVSEKKLEKQVRREQRQYAPPVGQRPQTVVVPEQATDAGNKAGRKIAEKYRQAEPRSVAPPVASTQDDRGDRPASKLEKRGRS